MAEPIDGSGSERRESPYLVYQERGAVVPVPDPTLLTTSLVEKAIGALRSELSVQFTAMAEATRLVRDAYDKLVDGIPSQLSEQSEKLKELWAATLAATEERIKKLDDVSKEQFARIAIQFDERDKRTEQLSQAQKEAANALSLASATAIAAALQAQKEAAGAQNDSNAASITKSEAAFTKQIDQMAVLVQQIQKGNDDKVSDLKSSIASIASRLDRGEGGASSIENERRGRHETVIEQHGSSSNAISIIAIGVSLVAILSVIALNFVTHFK